VLWQDKIDRSIEANRAFQTHTTAALRPKVRKVFRRRDFISAPGIRIGTTRFCLTIEKIVRGLHRLCAGATQRSDGFSENRRTVFRDSASKPRVHRSALQVPSIRRLRRPVAVAWLDQNRDAVALTAVLDNFGLGFAGANSL
jgi:hypothetical protein